MLFSLLVMGVYISHIKLNINTKYLRTCLEDRSQLNGLYIYIAECCSTLDLHDKGQLQFTIEQFLSRCYLHIHM